MFTSQEKLIAEIHHEFDTAQDRLLEQAETLLSSLNIPTESRIEEVADRLAKIGFVNTPTVHKASTLKERRKSEEKLLVTTKEQAELINYYKFNYPFLKFLTEDELNRICVKYKLIHAPVANYIKEVPEKNLRDIENAQKPKEGDAIEDNLYFKSAYGTGSQRHIDQTFLDLGLINGQIKPSDILRVISESKYISSSRVAPHYQETFLSDNTWLFLISSRDMLRQGAHNWNYKSISRVSKAGLHIAAPESHFNLKGLEKKSAHGFFQVFKTEVKDPIVFRYVRGGVLILTKWSVEGEDPSLVVEKLN